MFTGIIGSIGTIEASEKKGDLQVRIASDLRDLAAGASVAVNGVCLTVTQPAAGGFAASLSDETVRRTAPGRWDKGQKVNLEPALKLGDTLDGHMVSGHVDGVAMITGITPSLPSPASGRGKEEGSHVLEVEAPKALARFIAEKGSVTLDGVSLTVNQVEANRFRVNIIPHTWRHTTLGQRRAGDALNLEVDMLARYVDRLLQMRQET